MSSIRLLLVATMCCIGSASGASAETWHVRPDSTGDAPTIQAGIDSASAGDTVLCHAGVYVGDGNRDLDFAGKNILLASTTGPQETAIDCGGAAGEPHIGVFFHSGEDSAATVEGFTITGAHSDERGAITITASTPTIRNCIITDNEGDGIDCYPGFPPTGIIRIENCLITSNSGNGLQAWGARTKIQRSDIAFNGLNGVSIDYSGEVEMSECIARSNGDIGLYIFTLLAPFTVTNCTFYGNRVGFFWDANFPKVGVAASDSSLLSNSVFAFNHEQGVLAYLTAPAQQIRCSNSYGNGVADWEGSDFGDGDDYGNFSAHPLFCDVSEEQFGIAGNSPCAPSNNDCGVLIGAVGVMCVYTGIFDNGSGSVIPRVRLRQNYPNPFNPSTTLPYVIPESGRTKLGVYDVAGQLVRILVDGVESAGENEATWDGRDQSGSVVASGVYFARLEFGSEVVTRKVLLVK